MARTALAIVDMLNPYDHEDAEPLAVSARDAVPHIAALRDHAMAADDVLVVYVNDNHEHWDYTREDLVERALRGRHPELIEPIAPPRGLPFLVKGRHSIFYQSSVDHLLQVQGVEALVLCGQVTEQCIQYSALDAYIRGYEVRVPHDAVAHIVPDWAEAALGMMAENMHAEVDSADALFTAFR